MAQEITVNRIGRALHIRLDRADKRNAVTRSMYEAMSEAIAIAETDPGDQGRPVQRRGRRLLRRQ
jgi:enoyl-CoA hydratase/carnithine racemase